MKGLELYIKEGLKLGSSKIKTYSVRPETKEELYNIIKDRLEKDKNADLNDIDISEITDMSHLFDGLDPFDIKIDQWDVSRVTNMSYMFGWCDMFNADISGWDVSRVTNMQSMFRCCNDFDCDLNNWNVSNVTDMTRIFYRSKLEKNPPKWFKKS